MKKLVYHVLMVLLLSCLCLATTKTVPIMGDTVNDSDIMSLVKLAMGNSYDGLEHDLLVEERNVILKLNPGVTEELMAAGKYNSDVQSAWNKMLDSFQQTSKSGVELLASIGVTDGSFTVLVEDDVNKIDANIFLCIINGVIVQNYYG